jgi:hypothetical protein
LKQRRNCDVPNDGFGRRLSKGTRRRRTVSVVKLMPKCPRIENDGATLASMATWNFHDVVLLFSPRDPRVHFS